MLSPITESFCYFSQKRWPADFMAREPQSHVALSLFPFPFLARQRFVQAPNHNAEGSSALCGFCSLHFLYTRTWEKVSPHLPTAAGATRELQSFLCIFFHSCVKGEKSPSQSIANLHKVHEEWCTKNC